MLEKLELAMNEWREDIEAVRTLGLRKFLYLRFVYRHHMRFIHRRGAHQMKAIHPMGGPSFSRCDWCGHIDLQSKEEGEGR